MKARHFVTALVTPTQRWGFRVNTLVVGEKSGCGFLLRCDLAIHCFVYDAALKRNALGVCWPVCLHLQADLIAIQLNKIS